MKLKTAFSDAGRAVKGFFRNIFNTMNDAERAWENPRALSPGKRHVEEAKIIVGIFALVIGTIEASPIAAIGGAVTAWEGVQEFEEAGHRWHLHHPQHRPH